MMKYSHELRQISLISLNSALAAGFAIIHRAFVKEQQNYSSCVRPAYFCPDP